MATSICDLTGVAYEGLFLRTATSLICLDCPEVQFDDFEEGDDIYSPDVEGYREVDVTVTVCAR